MKEIVLSLVFLSVSLDLIFAQVVTFHPQEARVAIGDLKQIRCFLQPETEADASYHWYDVQGNEVTTTNSNEPKYVRPAPGGQKGKTLYIEVTDDDQGRYKCKIVVDGNEYEGYFQLDTYAPITISNCDVNQHGTKGQDGKLTCSATAGGVNVIAYWERNGALLTPDTDPRYRIEGTTVLAITNVTDSDKGTYRYVAETTELGVEVKDIYFDVWTIPVITKPVLETTGVDGGNATLYCEAIGYPEVEFSWYKEGSLMRDQGELGRIRIKKFQQQSQLQFRPVLKDDKGTYRCEVRNAAGTAESSTQVIVLTPPRISELRNLTRTENQGATLWCNASGDPRPRMELVRMDTGYRFTTGDNTASWTVSTGDLGDIHTPGTWFKLDIASVRYQDAGNYRCEALNQAGDDSKVLSLEVNFAPKFDQQSNGPFYNWVGNTDGHLPCVAKANPLPVFRWLRQNGVEITNADPFFSIVNEEHRNDKDKYPDQEREKYTVTSKLMITYNGQNDKEVFGNFKCEARNTINMTSTVLTMSKASVPGQPTFSKSRETATELDIEFTAQSVAGPPVDMFKAVISKAGGSEDPRIVTVQAEWRDFADDLPSGEIRTKMSIKNLEPSTRYSLTLYAINPVGDGTPLEIIHTTKPLSAPGMVEVLNDINSPFPGDIEVRWEEPDNGGQAIINYYVEYRQVAVKNTTNIDGGYDYLGPIQNQDWTSVQLSPNILRYRIQRLLPGRYYQVQVKATNAQGTSTGKPKIIKTKDAELVPGATTAKPPVREVRADDAGLSTGVIIGIVVAIFVVLFIIVDLTCYFKNNCGILMCIRERIAGARDEGYSAAKTDDVENLAKKDHLEEAKSAEEGEMAAEQEEEKKEPLLSEEQTVETVDEGEKLVQSNGKSHKGEEDGRNGTGGQGGKTSGDDRK